MSGRSSGVVLGDRARSSRERPLRVRLRPIVRQVLTHVVLIVLSVVFLFPFAWMVSASFKPEGDIFNPGINLIPAHPTWQNYQDAFGMMPLWRNLFNSLVIAATTMAGSVFLSSLAGFAFAKLVFPGKRLLFIAVLSTMMVPQFVALVPQYVLMSKIGWINSYQAVILPSVASAFGIFFMTQYMASIPNELLDAARIDGCRDLGIYARVIMPNVKPALAALGIMAFMGAWNNFMWPLMVLQSNDMYTIVLAVVNLPSGSGFNTPWGAVMAGSTVAVLPLIALFVAFQRYFIAGVMQAGLKG